MDIKINMLDVCDGDAIIVELKNGINNIVVLIDAGRKQYSEKIISKLNNVLSNLGKQGPDLFVITHYDSDHIGGASSIINYYKNKIKELWIHQPKFITGNFINPVFLTNKMVTLEENCARAEKLSIVIESVNDLNDVISSANNVGIAKIREPFAGECGFDGWPTLEILGPSKKFYNEVFANIINTENFINAESDGLIIEGMRPSVIESGNPFDNLPTTSKITATNKASVIIKILVDGKVYLFTGDAGIESFINIRNYKQVLNDIYWLKAPHHGSVNNLSAELIKLMKPKHCYVSGDKYVDSVVIDCFKKCGSNVAVTTSGDLLFPNQSTNMLDYLRTLG